MENKESSHISFKIGASYGCGNFAANLLVTAAGAFISYFYTEVGGIPIGIVGLILLLCRLLDGLSDLLMGLIVDRTKTRYGKARPWLLWLSFPFLLASIALWWAPDFSMSGRIVYASLTYILSIVIIYTGLAVPYNTLCSLLTHSSSGRINLSAWRTGLGFSGVLFVNMATLPIVNFFGGGSKGWLCLGTIYGLTGCLLYLLIFLNCKELPLLTNINQQNSSDFTVLTSIKYLFKNKYWLMMIAIILVTFTISGLAGANVYYAQYVFKNPDLVGQMSIAGTIPMLLTTLVITPLSKRIGKKSIAIAGSLISLLGIIIMGMFWQDWNMFFIGLVIKGCGQAPVMVSTFSMIADTIDFGEWKFGIRSDGLAYSAEGFGEKVGGALGGVIVTSLMAVGGYVAKQSIQTPEVFWALRSSVIYVPAITTIITIGILFFYDLDTIHPQIMDELAKRK